MSNPHRRARREKRNKAYVKRFPKRVPMMRPLRDQISLDMHAALAALRTAPSDDARTDLASTFNTVSVAIEWDARFEEEREHLRLGALCLEAYAAPAPLTDDQLARLAHTCSVIDTVLGLIDVGTLYASERTAVALARAARESASRTQGA